MTNEKFKRIELLPIGQRPQMKKWLASQLKGKWVDVKQFNLQMNNAFMLLIERVKRLYKGSNTHVFERDQRLDNSMNGTVMHSLITPNLFLELECDQVSHKCYILFDFQHCPFEDAIRKWLKEYPFSMASKHEPCKGGIAAYHKRILAYQGDKHFNIL